MPSETIHDSGLEGSTGAHVEVTVKDSFVSGTIRKNVEHWGKFCTDKFIFDKGQG